MYWSEVLYRFGRFDQLPAKFIVGSYVMHFAGLETSVDRFTPASHRIGAGERRSASESRDSTAVRHCAPRAANVRCMIGDTTMSGYDMPYSQV